MLQSDSRVDREAVHVFEVRNPILDMVLNRLGQRHVMRRKNQLHIRQLAQGPPENPALACDFRA
jgi:hypothetical protein